MEEEEKPAVDYPCVRGTGPGARTPWQGRKSIGRYRNCQVKFRGQFVDLTDFSDWTSYDCLDRSDESVFSDTPEELDLPVLECPSVPPGALGTIPESAWPVQVQEHVATGGTVFLHLGPGGPG